MKTPRHELLAAAAAFAAMPDWSPPRRRGRSLLNRYKLSLNNGTELNKTQQVLQKIFKDARYELFVIMLVLMYAGITLISIMDQDLIANVPLLARTLRYFLAPAGSVYLYNDQVALFGTTQAECRALFDRALVAEGLRAELAQVQARAVAAEQRADAAEATAREAAVREAASRQVAALVAQA